MTERGTVLESWKAIAEHLGRKVRTCQKWEKDLGLPVHRLDDSPKARVFAYAEELSRWREDRLKEGALNAAAHKIRGFRRLVHILPRWNKALIVGLATFAVVAVVISALLIRHQSRVRWANDVAIPEIERLLLASDGEGAFDLAATARKIATGSPGIARLMSLVSGTLSVESDPMAVDISVRPYGDSGAPWRFLGRTPLSRRAMAPGYKHWKAERRGFAPAEGVVQVFASRDQRLEFKLDDARGAPPGMVRVRGGMSDLPYAQLRFNRPLELPDYWIDKYEVTNAEYRAFVDAGGYADRRYWKNSVERDGRILAWEEAMREFVDRTGRPGPAAWESGACPPGRDNFPVTGVSWYEAAAYAEFAGKRLPSVYHWTFASGAREEIGYVVPWSNLAGRALAPVGTFDSLSVFGAYDMAGNAKEWCANEAGGGLANLGGAWDESAETFGVFESYPALTRALDFGFRCMKAAREEEDPQAAFGLLLIAEEPDFRKAKPCSDEVFEAYRALYDFTRIGLDARVESTKIWSPDTILEDVSLADPEGGGRYVVHLFLPRRVAPPFQSFVHLPLTEAEALVSVSDYWPIKTGEVEIITRGGRAVVLPEFWGTFGRRPAVPPERTRQFFRERMIRRHRELVRCLDYLETRPDFDKGRIAYVGAGTGAWSGAIHVALERRFKVAVLLGGGFYWEIPGTASPEWDVVNFAPRVKIPVLMQNGEFDACFKLQTNVRPFFRLLGTPDKDKHLRVYPMGHSVWLSNVYRRDLLDFLDKYLGPAGVRPGVPAGKYYGEQQIY